MTKNEFLFRLAELGREYEVLHDTAMKMEGFIHDLIKELEEAEDTIQKLREELVNARTGAASNTGAQAKEAKA